MQLKNDPRTEPRYLAVWNGERKAENPIRLITEDMVDRYGGYRDWVIFPITAYGQPFLVEKVTPQYARKPVSV